MTAILGLFSLIPGWLWALMLAGSLATGCVEQHKLANTRLELQTLKTAVADQKAKAAQTLADETAKTLQAERKLTEAVQKQEQTDAKNAAVVRDLRTRTVGLRDPFGGCGTGSGGAKGQVTGPANPGTADNPQTSGALSTDFARLLWDQAAAADEINIAFASCKAFLDTLKDTP